MSRKPLSRRAVLRGAGGACIALPLLDIMAPTQASAQLGVPRRLVTMYSPNGQISDKWVPTGTERDFELSECLEPLEAHKQKLIVLDGINNDASKDKTFGGHQGSHAAMISGWPPTNTDSFEKMRPGGPSLDQVVADKIGGDTKFKSLQTGVLSGSESNPFGTVSSWRGEKELLAPQAEPPRVFDFLFKDAAVATETSSTAEDLLLRRKSILDGVLGRYERLNARLGMEDRARLEIHISSIRELERRVLTDPGVSCSVPTAPDPKFDRSPDNFDAYGHVQMDLIAAALACGLTHVASFIWFGMGAAHTTLSNLGHNENHHGLAHSNNVPRLVEASRFFAGQLGYLMDSLDKYSESDGSTLLDNTMILWWNELGTGNGHKSDPAPFVLAGGAGGSVEMGRFIRFGERRQSNDVLLSVHNAVTDSNDDVFGDPRYSNGPLLGG